MTLWWLLPELGIHLQRKQNGHRELREVYLTLLPILNNKNPPKWGRTWVMLLGRKKQPYFQVNRKGMKTDLSSPLPEVT